MEMKRVSEFFENYNFTNEEREIIKDYNGEESYLLYHAFINTDLEDSDENLYLVFRANFIDDIDE